MNSDRELLTRLKALEDRVAIESLIAKIESLRDETTEKINDILDYVIPEAHFRWTLDGVNMNGKDELRKRFDSERKGKLWSRHVITNLQIKIDGDGAEVNWYVAAEGMRKSLDSNLPSSIIHSDTKGRKHCTLTRTQEGWKISDYVTDMQRVTSATLAA